MTASSFLIKLDEQLDRGPVVLATVMQCTGSTPRQPGAQMACGPDWLLGTIGGGAAESKVITAARLSINDQKPSEVTIDLRGTLDHLKDGICGGTMLIRLDPLDLACRSNLQEANRKLADGHAIQQLFPPDGSWSLQTLDDTAPSQPDERWILKPDPMLLIVGAGHCGVALAHSAASIGFRIILQDDRPEMAPVAELPAGTIRSSTPVDQTLNAINWPDPLYIALVTRSYQHDVDAILHLATKTVKYAGLMGSRRRLHQVMKMLREHDVPESFIEFLDAPIGIDLPVETPEEIAVSICASLIQVRNADSRRSAPLAPDTAVPLGC